jgi:hypothetical protein
MYNSLNSPGSPIQKITDFSGTLFAYPTKEYSPNVPILYGDLSVTDSVWYDTSLHVASTDFTSLVLYNIYLHLFPTILVTNIIIILFGCYRSMLDMLEKED